MRHLRPTCSHCIFWMADSATNPPTVGHCHRFPPGIHVNPQTGTVIQKFPATDARHWCGEWDNDESWFDEALRKTTAKSAS